MWIIRYRLVWFFLSGVLIVASLSLPFIVNVERGIDFTGGTSIELSSPQGFDKERAEQAVQSLVKDASVRLSGEGNVSVRTRPLSEEERQQLVSALTQVGGEGVVVEKLTTIGPSIGASMTRKAYQAVALVIIAIVGFITFAFRKVSQPVSSWKYGFATIIALAHDVILAFGVYLVMGIFFGAQIDILFVSAILAILGYSVHDTIVVFDRVREHLSHNITIHKNEPFEVTVGESIKSTMARSVNTSVTLFFVLLALVLFGGEATRNFTMIMLVGVVIGTYSSLFIAAPLLVTFGNHSSKK